MNFIKDFNVRKGREPGFGSLYIANGFLKLRINVPNAHVEAMGAVEDGIGCVIKAGDKNRKTPYIATCFKYEKDWLPCNFQGEGYRFSIPAKKISDTEFVFLFKNAKMLNKK